jgi:hypothetical protein
MNPELFVDVTHMKFDGVDTDAELFGGGCEIVTFDDEF